MSFKHLSKIILAIFLVIFAINLSLATEFEPTSHDANTSVDGNTIWVQKNSTTVFAVQFENNASSINNVTQINFWTTGSGIALNDIVCPSGWNHTGFTTKSIECQASTSVLESGDIVYVNSTINSNYVTSNTVTVWNWYTTDDNASYADSGNFSIGIDVTGPAISIFQATPSVGSAIGNGNVTFNVSVIENEVQINKTTGTLSSSGNCSSAIHSALTEVSCSTNNKTCNYSFVMDAKNSVTDGSCSIIVRFNDTFRNAGNTTGTYQIDNKGPVIELTSGSELRSGSLVTFNITDSPAGVDDSWWTNDSGVTNYTLGAGIDTTGWLDGDYTVNVWANDTLGNLGDKITSGGTNSTSITVTIDGTAPNVTIIKPIAGYFGNVIPVNVTVEDENNVSSVKALIAGSETSLNRTSGTNFWTGTIDSSSIAAPGPYNLTINASDMAGNYNDSESVSGIIMDHIKPVILILDPDEGELIKTSSIVVNANVNENASECIASFDNTINVTMTSTDSTNWTGSKSLRNGDHRVKVYCADTAKNWNVTENVNFDVLAPSGGGGGGTPFNTTTVQLIENHEPKLTAPSIDNEAPKKGETITCISGKFSDEDGDSKSGEQWKWFVNGNAVSGSSNKFDTSSANAGDEITCSQRVTDGISYSAWEESSNSAIVQEPLKVTEETTAAKTEDSKKPVNPFTGAFIGSLLGDNVFLAIAAVVVMGGSVAVLAIRFIKRRGLKFKVE